MAFATLAYAASCSSSARSAAGCSRISARNCCPGPPVAISSASDTRLSADENALDAKTVVEDDDVRGDAARDTAGRVGAEDPGGDGGCRVERLLERDAERVEVAHRLDHRQHA